MAAHFRIPTKVDASAELEAVAAEIAERVRCSTGWCGIGLGITWS